MFGSRVQRQARHVAERIVRPLAAIGVTPNIATLLGLLLNGVAAAVLATGHLRLGGALALGAGIFDMFDGALARVQNKKTTFGAFFDSTLDRYSEGLVLLGVLLYAAGRPATPGRVWVLGLTYVAALSSLMVSYAKARAEGLGLECRIGLMARPERVLLLAAGLTLGGAGWLLWTMAALALTSTFTAVQRIVHVWREATRATTARAANGARPAGGARLAARRRIARSTPVWWPRPARDGSRPAAGGHAGGDGAAGLHDPAGRVPPPAP
jgi:CDP-diacylglycerol--glycerol-3-phosphate 3-phosphatidyltransferase